jgi:hypothetical protein
VEEREDRALQRDNLDPRGAKGQDDGPKRFPQAMRTGTRERDFFD